MMATNGKLFSFDKTEINPARKKVSIKHTVVDVVIFLLTSLGYIIQVSESTLEYTYDSWVSSGGTFTGMTTPLLG